MHVCVIYFAEVYCLCFLYALQLLILFSTLHNIYSCTHPFTHPQSVVNASVAHMHAKAKGQLEYKELEYGHRRLDPARGVDYILSLVFRDNTSGRRVTRK